MAEVDRIISSHGLKKVWNKKTFQNFVEYSSNGKKHQVWIEDKKSIGLLLNLLKQNHLGGVSAWYIGSEPLTFGMYIILINSLTEKLRIVEVVQLVE